jgi:hypothetical protein
MFDGFDIVENLRVITVARRAHKEPEGDLSSASYCRHTAGIV